MKRRNILTLSILLTACMLFAGGQKEHDTSWYKDYTEEEKKLIEKYEIDDSDLSKYSKLDFLMNDVADIKLYGNTMDSIHELDRAGYMRDVYDNPLHALDYYDSYINSLTYNEISRKWFISRETYNEWVLDSMWNESLKQTEEIRHAAESKLFTDFALTDIYSLDQLNAVNAYAGFTDKLNANGNGLVGKTLVMDVLSFAEHVLDSTDNPVFSTTEFHALLKDRFEDDKAAIEAEKITVDAENKAIIDDFGANLERYSNILYREHWFDETYISYYYQPIPISKTVTVRDWDLGVGASIGLGFSGLTVSGYMKNLGITGFIGNYGFKPNVSFGIGMDYNWHIRNGHHFGIGINAICGFDFIDSYENSHNSSHNSNGGYNQYDPYYGNNGYNGNSSYPNNNGYDDNMNSNNRYEGPTTQFSMVLEFPISYKYCFQNLPLMISATSNLAVTSGYEGSLFIGGFTVGLQYMVF